MLRPLKSNTKLPTCSFHEGNLLTKRCSRPSAEPCGGMHTSIQWLSPSPTLALQWCTCMISSRPPQLHAKSVGACRHMSQRSWRNLHSALAALHVSVNAGREGSNKV